MGCWQAAAWVCVAGGGLTAGGRRWLGGGWLPVQRERKGACCSEGQQWSGAGLGPPHAKSTGILNYGYGQLRAAGRRSCDLQWGFPHNLCTLTSTPVLLPSAGAFGCTISGAGPTAVAIVRDRDHGERVKEAMVAAFKRHGDLEVNSAKVTRLDNEGAKLVS